MADIPPAGSLPCSRCTQGMSWRRPATPLSCGGNQALAAGSETRRRSVDGRVCLRNSPRPGESRSHLSGSPSATVGLVPPAWQWHLGGEVVNKHLSIGSLEFLVFLCLRLPLVQSWLGTALARQIPSRLLFLSPMLLPSPRPFLPHPFPFPLLLPSNFPLSLDALPIQVPSFP